MPRGRAKITRFFSDIRLIEDAPGVQGRQKRVIHLMTATVSGSELTRVFIEFFDGVASHQGRYVTANAFISISVSLSDFRDTLTFVEKDPEAIVDFITDDANAVIRFRLLPSTAFTDEDTVPGAKDH